MALRLQQDSNLRSQVLYGRIEQPQKVTEPGIVGQPIRNLVLSSNVLLGIFPRLVLIWLTYPHDKQQLQTALLHVCRPYGSDE